MKRICLFFILCTINFSVFAAREVYDLSNDWRFFYTMENSSDDARYVNLPHSWSLDNGRIQQCSANYMRRLYVDENWKGKRLFLRFGGVQTVADVFVNGRQVGEHRGAFTAFTFEITNQVFFGSENTILVVVSNAQRTDILPTSTLMNIYGGINRGVELIVAPQTLISPLYYGTSGAFLRTTTISGDLVEGTVDVMLSSLKETTATLEVEIMAPDGYSAFSKSVKTKIDGHIVSVPFQVQHAELWSRKHPNLYTIVVRTGEDEVSFRTGFRSLSVTVDKKFEINGRREYVRGVCLGHDSRNGLGAITKKEMMDDLSIINDIGANAFRSLTGPHDAYLYDMADRCGVLVWIDIPLQHTPFLSDIAFFSTPLYEQNALQQLREIILQNINHPSVSMWGIFSELRSRNSEVMDFVRKLNKEAHKLDMSRPTVACSNQDGDINFITDLIVWRQDVGWSEGTVSDVLVWQDALKKNWSHLKQAICYGEAGTFGLGSDAGDLRTLSTHRVPETAQILFHEGYAGLIDTEFFWGVWINSLFDYGSTRFKDGTRNSGIICKDHVTCKDIFHMYRALWNKSERTLFLAGKKRAVTRRSRHVLHIYSSLLNPELTINEEQIPLKELYPSVYVTDSIDMLGENRIVVRADNLSDSMTLTIGSARRIY
ncbi:MAG: beta-galactosidase [Alistipes sp.]|nr:beta-galactosidase [Candidatus Alistipes equi]